MGDDFFLPNPFPPFEPGGQQPGGKAEALSSWGKLIRGQPVGKSVAIRYTVPGITAPPPTFAPADILTINGGVDADSVPMVVQLSPPKVVRTTGITVPDNLQNISGTQDNFEVYDTANPFEFVPVIAEITWGIGGGNNKVEVDITNGATVNVFGSFVRVRAGIDLRFAAGGFWGSTTPAVYQLAAQVAPGYGRGTGCKRTFILESGLADQAFTNFFPIPRFAKRVQVFGLNLAAGGGSPFVGLVEFFLGPDVGQPFGSVLVQANIPTPAMIPGGPMYYRVQNLSGVAMQIMPTFELDI